MRLNKSTGHAIRILIECARSDGRLVKVADLAERLELTMQNVFKIVHLLSRADLIAAERGRNGGVGLARSADEIRMGDIVRAMEATDMGVETAALRAGARKSAVNGVNRVLDTALDAFVAVLDQHTLADMAGSNKAKMGAATPVARERKSPQSKSARSVSRARPTARSSGN
jgi:Rrf2 family nitric oxide-sensitive transcriptional repressor